MESPAKAFAVTANVNKSDNKVKRGDQYPALEDLFESLKIEKPAPAVFFIQEGFTKKKLPTKIQNILGNSYTLEKLFERGDLWNGIVTNDDFFGDVVALDDSLRQRVLERLRRPDTDFFTEDARAIFCTATVKNSQGTTTDPAAATKPPAGPEPATTAEFVGTAAGGDVGDQGKKILLVSYHGPHGAQGLDAAKRVKNFKDFLKFVAAVKEETKCDFVLAGVDSNLVGGGADGFAAENAEFLRNLGLKIVVGNRANSDKIDCFVLSDNLLTENDRTFDVPLRIIGHYPVGIDVSFEKNVATAAEPVAVIEPVVATTEPAEDPAPAAAAAEIGATVAVESAGGDVEDQEKDGSNEKTSEPSKEEPTDEEEQDKRRGKPSSSTRPNQP